MITNDIVTAIRRTEEGYSAVYSGPCMRQDVKAYEVKQYGEENADSAAVYVPDVSADVEKGDYIIFGEVPEDLSEAVKSALTAVSVTRYDYGSANMRHIRIGVD